MGLGCSLFFCLSVEGQRVSPERAAAEAFGWSEGWGVTGVTLVREPWVCTVYVKLHHCEVILKNLST